MHSNQQALGQGRVMVPTPARFGPRTPLAQAAAVLALAMVAGSTHAQAEDESELALAYGGQPEVSIATGSRLPLSRAPATATVITAEDIAATGATDLAEVLETVPGLHVSRFDQVYTPVYVIRGINLGYNPQVLVLLNGVPLTTPFSGNRGHNGDHFPLSNVQRIEVIRGPGSALYGAEAFAGVINIISKTAADIDGTQAGLRLGSFRSGDTWVLHGGQWGGFETAAFVQLGTTDGARRTIDADAQTGWDALLGTQASLAPGPVNNGRHFADVALDLARGAWRMRAAYRERSETGTGAGIASALDPVGHGRAHSFNADLSYEWEGLPSGWSLALQGSTLRYVEKADLVLYPPGTRLNPAGGAFADGMIGNPWKWQRQSRLGAAARYTGWAGHQWLLGAGLAEEAVYKVRERKNFNADFTPIGTGSLADVTDVSGTAPFLRPNGRRVRYAYVQDEWRAATDWTVTAGLRHDRYSDFGGTTNPRLAVVWDAAYDLTAKLLYGTAFRAPSMIELYAINNPVANGNPDLQPERIRTLEAGLSWQPTATAQLGFSAYRLEASDIIRRVGTIYQNVGRLRGRGLEIEGHWDPAPRWRLSGNYSLQNTTDAETGADAGNAPQHHFYLRADWRMHSGWTAHAQLNWLGRQLRQAGDTRAPVPETRTVDLTLRGEGVWRTLDLALRVRNLFDTDVREPSAFDPSAPFVSLPGDYPMPGRAISVEAVWHF